MKLSTTDGQSRQDEATNIKGQVQIAKAEDLRKHRQVADAARKLIRAAEKKYWEDLGDELEELADTLEDLDGTTEFTERVCRRGK